MCLRWSCDPVAAPAPNVCQQRLRAVPRPVAAGCARWRLTPATSGLQQARVRATAALLPAQAARGLRQLGLLVSVRCPATGNPACARARRPAADRTIKIWDTASGQLRLTLTGHIEQVTGLAVSPRHPYMFSCALDKMVKCWDLEQNKVGATPPPAPRQPARPRPPAARHAACPRRRPRSSATTTATCRASTAWRSTPPSTSS